MRICIVNPFFDDVPATAVQITGRYRHVEALAAALARRGHQVGVIQASHENKSEERNSVNFLYVRAPYRSADRLSGGPIGLGLLFRGNLKHVTESIDAFDPDAVHMNGVTLLQPLAAIGDWCQKRGRPLTVSYHGGAPRRAPWLQRAQRRILQRCRAVLFPSAAHAEVWISSGLLREQQVIECMEVSSEFTPCDRASARARTGLIGSPVFVWNASLSRRKDPLTALKGFSLIRASWPDARLYMIYLSDEMLHDVEATIASSLSLRESVQLLGFIPPSAVQDFFNSADFLIQTSLSEIGSYSVLEAMSCGVIPIITDIPLFRRVTNNGQLGVLVPVGDYRLVAERVLQINRSSIERLSDDILSFFTRSLSYEAIAKTYEVVLSGNRI